MSKLKEWMLIAAVALAGLVSMGADCDFTLRGSEDGLRFNVGNDDDDNNLLEDLEDLFD
ncbi:MAG TPA: hypothetical protein PKY77_03815 [Phycisphaerae bacterium]|nr:hypothetical protein [Phycisphaerae bacterium]HRY70856.1 hypothetical protein [Phycisphaerae bacterium]HSA28563.1 hypothetical protein [Phycisphaerae bacterium]